MKRMKSVAVMLLILAMLAGSAASIDVTDENKSPDVTRIELFPQNGDFRIQPGESKEMTVTLRNREDKEVKVKPKIIIVPYSTYNIDPEWVTITPKSAEIAADNSQQFSIKVTVPEDASIGHYDLQIAFTNETVPTLYPEPFPTYAHVFFLSVDVWTPPKIQIMAPYITDMIEPGKVYDYEVKLKNIGKEPIEIHPELIGDTFYEGPFGPMPPAFTDDAITIISPDSVPSGKTAGVKIHVEVPEEARGQYTGTINLNIDDPSMQQWESSISLDFNVKKQPTEPFVKAFTMAAKAPVIVEIITGVGYDYGISRKKDISFVTNIMGPTGEVDSKLTKKLMRGDVNMEQSAPWEDDGKDIYRESWIQLVETYIVNGTPGEWKLKVLPENTDNFQYTITIGE